MLELSEDEVSKWYDDLAAINEEVEKVESICQQEISPDMDTLERQRKEAKVDFFNCSSLGYPKCTCLYMYIGINYGTRMI